MTRERLPSVKFETGTTGDVGHRVQSTEELDKLEDEEKGSYKRMLVELYDEYFVSRL